MSLWTLTYSLTHESFSGHTHNDGNVKVEVRATTVAQAQQRGATKIHRQHPGYDARLVSYGRKANAPLSKSKPWKLKRYNMRAILADPMSRRLMIARGTVALQAMEGIDITLEEALESYDQVVKPERAILKELLEAVRDHRHAADRSMDLGVKGAARAKRVLRARIRMLNAEKAAAEFLKNTETKPQ